MCTQPPVNYQFVPLQAGKIVYFSNVTQCWGIHRSIRPYIIHIALPRVILNTIGPTICVNAACFSITSHWLEEKQMNLCIVWGAVMFALLMRILLVVTDPNHHWCKGHCEDLVERAHSLFCMLHESHQKMIYFCRNGNKLTAINKYLSAYGVHVWVCAWIRWGHPEDRLNKRSDRIQEQDKTCFTLRGGEASNSQMLYKKGEGCHSISFFSLVIHVYCLYLNQTEPDSNSTGFLLFMLDPDSILAGLL